jgi:hypothetical protein
MDHTIREVTDVELNPSNMKREDGFCLSKPWKPLMYSLKYHRKPPSEDSRDRFSTGPCRSTHRALITAPTVPIIPRPFLPVLASLQNFYSFFYPQCMPATSAPFCTDPCPAQHYYFPRSALAALFGAKASYPCLIYWFMIFCGRTN